MPSYKLYYFNVRASGEICRLAFSAANMEFEDYRVIIGSEEWPKLKESGKPPLGQMPFIEVDGKLLAQSGAITKYICKTGGLSPTDLFEEAKADMICDGVADLLHAFLKFFLEKDESKKEEVKKEFFEKTLPERLKQLQARLLEAAGGYFADGKLTYADISLFEFLNSCLAKGEPLVPEELNAFPLLTEHYNRVLNNPGIKAWVEKRPKSDF